MIISEIINTRPNAYQGMTGVDFKVEGNPNKISALTKDTAQFVVGAELSGEVVPKEKDGRTFYNWQFPKAGSRPYSGGSGGMSSEQFDRLLRMIEASQTASKMTLGAVQGLAQALRDKGVISGNQYGDGLDAERDIAEGVAW